MKRIAVTAVFLIVAIGAYLAGLGRLGTAVGASLMVAGMSFDYLFWHRLAPADRRQSRR